MSISSVIKDLKGRLDGKVAIITGGGSGIGYESAILFAREGASVVVADNDLKAAESCVERIKEKFPMHVRKHTLAYKVDVTKEEEVKKLVETTLKEFGKLDIMFNCAEIIHPHDDNCLNTDEKVWDVTMNTNVKGVWYGCKYAIEAMRRNSGCKGSIINTASYSGFLGSATPQIAYTASKGAVIALSRELAVTHARENIRVNTICPGPLRTPELLNLLNTDDKKNRRLCHIPIGRFGEPIESAQMALFLASDESSYVTGTEIKIDGGLTAAYVTPEEATTSLPPKNYFKTLEKK
ncbi:NAD(P)-binding protein [Gigaspora rosea]|uniref:NAD(P)-binding protein n=1 Tax=Gigaspora rosea TaxID=44941 RepID=A0A397V6R2_9GLOM|nr:NAD(P)-binding protein [Gigaspora rosea]